MFILTSLRDGNGVVNAREALVRTGLALQLSRHSQRGSRGTSSCDSGDVVSKHWALFEDRQLLTERPSRSTNCFGDSARRKDVPRIKFADSEFHADVRPFLG